MTNEKPKEPVKQGDWDGYASELWGTAPEALIASALEQAKIASENHKLAHGFRNTTAEYNKYSGRARDAEARQGVILQVLQAKEARRAGFRQMATNIALVIATWALVAATVWLAVSDRSPNETVSTSLPMVSTTAP